ncbi:MAG: hypothetical protein Q6362_001180 [Candidatus Wukongarchaeota archaeon]|jgi:hypothetical protein|nr:hypothetical protein [Candidatus Wukongarchaeota archaeon]MDO8128047.1 hypothetical protein [Candidatus Wukongarchaeota archaeon]
MPRARDFPFEKNKKLRLQDLEEISPIKFLRALVYVNQSHIRKYLEEHIKGAGGELPLEIFSESEKFFSCSFINSGYRVFITIEDERKVEVEIAYSPLYWSQSQALEIARLWNDLLSQSLPIWKIILGNVLEYAH